jgi:hypothetical protein
VTRLRLACHGFLWENQSHIGLANAGYEMKVRKADLEQATLRQRGKSPAAAL